MSTAHKHEYNKQEKSSFVFGILVSRYSKLLSDVVNMPGLVSKLVDEGALDPVKAREVDKGSSDGPYSWLAHELAFGGSTALVENSRVIENHKKSSTRKKETDFPTGGGGNHGRGGIPEAWFENPGDGGDESILGITLAAKNKAQIREVPDPPSTLPPPGHMTSCDSHKKMDSLENFSNLFGTFVSQLALTLQSLQVVTGTESLLNWCIVDVSLEEIRSLISDVVSSITNASTPDSCDGKEEEIDGPVGMSLSVLLEAFRQLRDEFVEAKSANEQFRNRADFIRRLVERNEQLERENRRMSEQLKGSEPEHQPFLFQAERSNNTSQQIRRLQELLESSEERNKQLAEVTQQWDIEYREKEEQANRLKEKVDELSGDLVCCKEESEAKIAALTMEIELLTTDRDTYKKKYTRAKRYFAEHKIGGSGNHGNPALERQLEELRLELYERKESTNLLMADKEQLVSELREQVREMEERMREAVEERDEHICQLQDQLDNCRIQFKSKEPSVKEVSLLSKEKRELTEKVASLQGEKSNLLNKISKLEKQALELGDELMAAKLHLEEVQQQPRQKPVRNQKPASKKLPKTQAMVTGYQPRHLISRDVQGPPLNRHPPSKPSPSPSPLHTPRDVSKGAAASGFADPQKMASSPKRSSSNSSEKYSPNSPKRVIEPAVPSSHSEVFSTGADQVDYVQSVKYPRHSKVLVRLDDSEKADILRHNSSGSANCSSSGKESESVVVPPFEPVVIVPKPRKNGYHRSVHKPRSLEQLPSDIMTSSQQQPLASGNNGWHSTDRLTRSYSDVSPMLSPEATFVCELEKPRPAPRFRRQQLTPPSSPPLASSYQLALLREAQMDNSDDASAVAMAMKHRPSSSPIKARHVDGDTATTVSDDDCDYCEEELEGEEKESFFSSSERKCPGCDQVFGWLNAAQFSSHVAECLTHTS